MTSFELIISTKTFDFPFFSICFAFFFVRRPSVSRFPPRKSRSFQNSKILEQKSQQAVALISNYLTSSDSLIDIYLTDLCIKLIERKLTSFPLVRFRYKVELSFIWSVGFRRSVIVVDLIILFRLRQINRTGN